MLRRKTHLMRAVRTEEAAALAVKVGAAKKSNSSAKLCKVDKLADPKSPLDKVRQLTWCTQSTSHDCQNLAITAESVDNHAAISSDAGYSTPRIKSE
jgi:hypothetical protein